MGFIVLSAKCIVLSIKNRYPFSVLSKSTIN